MSSRLLLGDASACFHGAVHTLCGPESLQQGSLQMHNGLPIYAVLLRTQQLSLQLPGFCGEIGIILQLSQAWARGQQRSKIAYEIT